MCFTVAPSAANLYPVPAWSHHRIDDKICQNIARHGPEVGAAHAVKISADRSMLRHIRLRSPDSSDIPLEPISFSDNAGLKRRI
jgi:hypothetical protein